MIRRNHRLLALPLLSLLALTGCNSLTGADQLSIVGSGDESGNESGDGGDDSGAGATGPSGSGAGPSGSGAGGQTGQGGHTGSTTDSTTDSTTTSSSSQTTTSSETPSTTSSTTTSTPVTDCEYPTGATGIDEGKVVSGNLAWQGYEEGASQSSTLSIQDYFDCDGSKGINAILIINSATWCGVCQEEATDLPSQAASFKAKGIRVLTLMVENNSGAPASLATATSWRDYFGLDDYATCADPNFTFAGFGSVGLPLNLVVNPRTMKIVDRTEGYGGYNAVIQLANQNAN